MPDYGQVGRSIEIYPDADGIAGQVLESDGPGNPPIWNTKQSPIQFKDEASNIGSNGGVSAVNFTGAGVSATHSSGTVTVSIPGGAGEAFPVGSVFIAVVSTNPGTLLGYGTWSAIAAGRVLVGLDSGDTDFDTVEETGGAKTHTLTTAELPAHSHTITDPTHEHDIYRERSATTGSSSTHIARTTDTSSTIDTTVTTQPSSTGITGTNNTGSDNAHNNVQPYFVVYMWKRTA